MSALAIARRKLAEIAAARLASTLDAADENNAVSPPADPPPDPYLVNFVSFVKEPDDAPDAAPPAVGDALAVDPAFAGPPGSLLGGLSDQLLASLRSQAAAGCRDSARQAVELADYLAACDRGEVVLPETPASVAIREWNRMVAERAKAKERGRTAPRKVR